MLEKNVAIWRDITIIKTDQYAPFITYCLNNKRTEIAKMLKEYLLFIHMLKIFKI